MWVLVLLSILGDQMGQNWLKMENSGHCAVLFEDPWIFTDRKLSSLHALMVANKVAAA